ncbi:MULTISPECIES: chromophore lyase CpcT/CpeT [Aquimarina]|uniref:Uncharacterized protein n=1 Tax=Aquimarina algiphila TaxID=2047982 RepID=A0A554VRA1_9FLAO|nr:MULTISPECIES: chromophore lyase CpcT/CpeT [Aquimarina]TSE11125.1 hypothetical protein FOF46_02545 [Aquimarina algiphila]
MKQFLPIIFLLIVFNSCNSKPIKDIELHNLATLMIGEFSNKEQSKKDNGFSHSHMINVRIWKDKPGYWIYSELSAVKENNYVYSQRIINYDRIDSITFKSTGYRILNEKDYKLGWKDIEVFDKLTLDSLQIRKGCQVYFKKKTSTIYSGKTNKGTCSSSIDHVDYISSSFVVSKDKISIWTRGYDEKGKQVWGKIRGPFKYKRLAKN